MIEDMLSKDPVLAETLSPENIVLIDCCLLGYKGHQSKGLCWETYDSRQYGHIDHRLLAEHHDYMANMMDLIMLPNVWSIEEVANEFYDTIKHLGGNIRYLSEHKRPPEHKRFKREYDIEKQKNALSDVHDIFYEVYRVLKSKSINYNKEISFDKNKIDVLFEMVNLLESKMKLKVDSNYIRGFRSEDRSHISDTDEKLVACLYYLSIYSDKKPVLLTVDNDFQKLLGKISPLIGSYSFFPDNGIFRRKLRANNFRLYMEINGVYELKLDSASDIRFNDDFMLPGLGRKECDKLKIDVAALWRNLISCKPKIYAS